jgi:lipoprotein-releasing system ATP-binding protein
MILKAKALSKSYGELKVLKNVDLEVDSGEIVSIVGASGAGKSTLLHILGTLDKPDSGSLEIAGQSIENLSSAQLAKVRNLNLGFVFQFHNLLPEFTALENVMLPAQIAAKPQKITLQKAKQLLELLGLEARMNHLATALSGGEQQRVAIARALINSPAIVLADEPSGNLDSKNTEELNRVIIELRNQLNQTFVIVTHNLAFAKMADRQLEMADGEIIKEIRY